MLPALLTIAMTSQVECGPHDRALFSDLQRLVGKTWRGTLTYLDYTSNKPTTIKSTLAVERIHSGPESWMWYFGYTDEPDHNSGQPISLRNDGRVVEDERVIARINLPNHGVQITTEYRGNDNDRPSSMLHVYRIHNDEFTLQLLVKPDGTEDFFERHIYRWRR